MTTNPGHPGRRKRPSKAAVKRLRAEVEARPDTRELPAALEAVIEAYNPPRVPTATMHRIKPFLRAAITASALTGPESVRKHCNHLTELARFAIERGTELEATQVLTTRFIDEYVRVGMAQETRALQSARRTRLLAMAATVNPGPESPAKLPPVGHSAIKPCYTPDELAVITRAARTQPTEVLRRDLSCVVALSAGAGCDSVDMRDLYVTSVEDLGPTGLRVHVAGPRPRGVPVRAGFEEMLRSVILGRSGEELLLGRKIDRRNTASRAIERAALHNVPHIEPARLRATWLADLMTDPIPLAVILQAAGLKSARTLTDLQPHLGPWLAHKGLSATGLSAMASTGAAADISGLRGETR